MSDNLRDRIAAVIESIRIQRDGDAARMADAVIRELGLPPTWGKPSFENGTTDD